MKQFILFFSLALVIAACGDQKKSNQEDSVQGVVTTFYVVRHAEKMLDGSTNPLLSKQGKARAHKLSRILEKEKITAIYSTPFKRTSATAEPTSIGQNVAVQVYDPSNNDGLVQQALQKYGGGKILIVGHSNTVPHIVNTIIKSDQYTDLKDSEYDKIFIVRLPHEGKPEVEVMLY